MKSEQSMISADVLTSALTGDPEALEAHLTLVHRDMLIDGHLIKIHCHCLAIDGNGRVQPKRLAEFMRTAVADYAIPRSKVAAAKERDRKFNSTEAVGRLMEEARRSFTDLAKTGEGGEMLLFLLAERFLKLPQILCKMDLKTDSRVHYHGADGIYAGITSEGMLKLYWGESKIYGNATDAIRACLASIAPFLIEQEHDGAERERDLVLLSDKADLSDPILNVALRRYFDKNSIMANKKLYCGIALVGFDAQFYPGERDRGIAEKIIEEARTGMEDWKASACDRLVTEKLQGVEIELLCVPLPSAEGFRQSFLNAMGLTV